jgi:ABC-type multidrug transport system fused ATPase/permease subunit
MSVGDVVFTQMIMSQITSRVRDIGRALRGVSEAFSNASETVEILRTPQGILDRPGAKPLRVTQAEIVFEAVRFAYHAKQTNHRVLSQVSCRIAPGEKVAFVGPSGAGKSTVMKLLMRDWEVVKGDIRIDGQSIAHITQESLRRAIGLVPQDPSLFHRSVADNIRIGRPSASLQEVEAAARSAHAHEFIMRLPDGYNTFVGERGVKLSGGERQRIAIARAMLKNAPILLLDEATSALDSESEALIQESLFSLLEGKTVLVIAHRLSTVMHMDRIFVLEGGKIVDQGTHTNLVSRPGVYQDLWSIQAGGFLGE